MEKAGNLQSSDLAVNFGKGLNLTEAIFSSENAGNNNVNLIKLRTTEDNVKVSIAWHISMLLFILHLENY